MRNGLPDSSSDVTYASITALSDLLNRSSIARPEHTAIEDPASGESLTYRELRQRARSVRDALVRANIRRGDRVGVYAPKSPTTVSAFFGILEAGAAYVPVDPAAPPARNAGILMDCSVSAVVISTMLVNRFLEEWRDARLGELEHLGGDLVLLGAIATAGKDVATDRGASLSDIAYILYTSGSTGKPKGVVHTHGSALSFIRWCSEAFAPTSDDRFSSHAPFHFDLSILDIYVAIAHGATLVLIGEESSKQPVALARLIAARQISIWYSTPSVLRFLVEYGRLNEVDCSALRLVLFAGEVFPIKHLRALKAAWPGPGYFNLYGPTETNVCTFFQIPETIPDQRSDPFPIGQACSGDRTMLAREEDGNAKSEKAAELLVSGGSVMQGYWNLPDATASSFSVDASGVSWYRTGDLVSETAGEGYVFMGRIDRMVKKRGYRVELGEIETALYRHPTVNQAAVTSSLDDENGVVINAFVVQSGTARPSLVEMKRFCAEQLPAYMIPDRFTFLPALPRTSTDKIDYKRLSEQI